MRNLTLGMSGRQGSIQQDIWASEAPLMLSVPSSNGTAPTPVEIRAALDKLLGDPLFSASARNRDFLRFVVEETLAGRGERLKAYTIAVDVFGRPSSFDGSLDPIVRIEASRLRTALSSYYSNPAVQPDIRISLPRGGYAPDFEWVDATPEVAGDQGAAAAEQKKPVASVSNMPEHATASPPAPDYVPGHSLTSPASIGEEKRTSAFIRLGARLFRLFRRESTGQIPILFVDQVEPLASDAQTKLLARTLTQSLISALGQFDGILLSNGEQATINLIQAEPKRPAYRLSSEVRIGQGAVHLWWSLMDMRSRRIFQSASEDGPWRPLSDEMLENQIAEKVAATIAHREGFIGSIAARTVDGPPQAGYPSVLYAREYMRTLEPHSFADGRNALERTVRLMPDYAEAWAYLAYMYADETRHAYDRPRPRDQSIALARTAAQHAMQLAPYSALSHLATMVAEFQAGNNEAFESAAERLLKLAPSDPRILVLIGNRLWAIGRREEGCALIRRGLALAKIPGPMAGLMLAFDHYVEAQYREALSTLTGTGQNVYLVPMLAAACYGQLGDIAAAQVQVRQLTLLRPDFAKEMRPTLRGLRFQPSIIDHLADGLGKAGFVVAGDDT